MSVSPASIYRQWRVELKSVKFLPSVATGNRCVLIACCICMKAND